MWKQCTTEPSQQNYRLGVGVEPPTKFSKRVTWQRLNFSRAVAGKEGWTFSERGCSFCLKNKLKSEIFNNKKDNKQKCFHVITNNLNNITGVHWNFLWLNELRNWLKNNKHPDHILAKTFHDAKLQDPPPKLRPS